MEMARLARHLSGRGTFCLGVQKLAQLDQNIDDWEFSILDVLCAMCLYLSQASEWEMALVLLRSSYLTS